MRDLRHPRVLHLVLAAAVALTVDGLATAAQPEEEVVVQSTSGTGIHRPLATRAEEYRIARQVSYADLDLVSHAGVLSLEARISDTADSICSKLGEMYGPTGFSQAECVRDAVRAAMTQAHTAIAVAEHEYKKHTAGVGARR